MTQSLTLTQLFNDININDMIRKLSAYRNESDAIKSELFYILAIDQIKVELIPTRKEQLYYCTRIVKNTLCNNSSYHKEFRNLGKTKKFITVSTEDYLPQIAEQEQEEESKRQIIIDRINIILNTEVPWYNAHIFRLYYLPFQDPNCEKKVYSLRDIERMHTCGEYRIDHVAIFHKVKIVLNFILKKLKDEKLITEKDIKNEKLKKIFKDT